MKRGRSIVKEIRSSETFGALNYRQRDLFQGLIEVADDQGRMPGNAASIRANVWSYDDISLADVQAELDVLAGGADPFILIYQVGGKSYLQIINWWKYQQMSWAAKSIYPAPDGWVDRVRMQGSGRKPVVINWDQEGGFQRLPSDLPSGLGSGLPKGLGSGQADVYCSESVKDKDKVKDKEKDKDKVKLTPPHDDNNLTLSLAQEAWNFAKSEMLADGMKKADYDTWLSGLQVSEVKDSTILVHAINSYGADWLKMRCKSMLEQKLRGFLGRNIDLVITTGQLAVEKPPGREQVITAASRA